MPLQLPTLDDRSYADLVTEARRLIPTLDPQWTNHNPSDPGITLIELFAYLTEMLLYRLDRVTVANQQKFLKLLNGPAWRPGPDLAADIRATIKAVRARNRAITALDFERLATEDFNELVQTQSALESPGPFDAVLARQVLATWWTATKLDVQPENLPSQVGTVARAVCVPQRNLERGSAAEQAAYAPDHVSLVVVPKASAGAVVPLQPAPLMRAALFGYLDEWRLVTTRHHVSGPYYAPVSAAIVIASASDAPVEDVRSRVIAELTKLLEQGPSGQGWPFGRDIYVSELLQRIELLDGVDYIADLLLTSPVLSNDARCVAAAQVWHEQGDMIGLALEPHHLPLVRLSAPHTVIEVISNNKFVQVQITVRARFASNSDAAAVRRDIKQVLRASLLPNVELDVIAVGGNQQRTGRALSTLEEELSTISGLQSADLELQAAPARLAFEGETLRGLLLLKGEAVSWRIDIVEVT